MAAMRGKTRLKKLIVGSIADYLPWPKNWLYPIAKKKEISAWPRDDWHMSFKDLLANDGKYTPIPRRRRTCGTRWRCCNIPAARPACPRAPC